MGDYIFTVLFILWYYPAMSPDIKPQVKYGLVTESAIGEELQGVARGVFDRLSEFARLGDQNGLNDIYLGMYYSLWLNGKVIGFVHSPYRTIDEEITELRFSSPDLFTGSDVDGDFLRENSLEFVLGLNDDDQIEAWVEFEETQEHLDEANESLWQGEQADRESDPEYEFVSHERNSGDFPFQPSEDFLNRLRRLIGADGIRVGDQWGVSVYPSD